MFLSFMAGKFHGGLVPVEEEEEKKKHYSKIMISSKSHVLTGAISEKLNFRRRFHICLECNWDLPSVPAECNNDIQTNDSTLAIFIRRLRWEKNPAEAQILPKSIAC